MRLSDFLTKSSISHLSKTDIGLGKFNLNFTYSPGQDNNKMLYVIDSSLPDQENDPFDRDVFAAGLSRGYPEFNTYNPTLTDTEYYILRKDLICGDLIIPDGKKLYTNGYKIYCQRLFLSGEINAQGKNGRNGVIRPNYVRITETNSWNDITYQTPSVFRSTNTAGYARDLGAFDVQSKNPPFGINSRSDADYEINDPPNSASTTIGNYKADGGLGVVGGGTGSNFLFMKLSDESHSVGVSVANSLAAPIGGVSRGGRGGGSAYGSIDTNEQYSEDGALGGAADPPDISKVSIESLIMGYNTDLAETRHYTAGAGGGGGGSTESDRNSDGDGDNRNYRGVATGGCGGDGGGAIWISAKTIFVESTGKIIANGGNGGAGRAYTDIYRSGSTIYSNGQAYSFSGGGGGGSGGWIVLITEKLINKGIISVKGGTGGNQESGYISTTTANNLKGENGDNGKIYIICPSSPHINAGFEISDGELSQSTGVASSWL